MPFYEEAIKAAEEMEAELKVKPDIWMTTHKHGNRNMYVLRTRDAATATAMLNAQDMLEALKRYQQMCECASADWKQHIESLIERCARS